MLRGPLDQLQTGQRLLGHEFTYELPAEPVCTNVDVNKLPQVLTKLVSNALKFTPNSGLVVVRVAAGPAVVRIEVKDNGVGIPPALQLYLCEWFTKARRPGRRGEATTGRALARARGKTNVGGTTATSRWSARWARAAPSRWKSRGPSTVATRPRRAHRP